MKPLIAIIGARGNMGKAFTRLFRKMGMKVLEVDRNSAITGKEAIAKADITLFSVPISLTPGVIRKLAPHAKKTGLLLDIASIKLPAVEALTRFAPKSCEILSLHPMFGPDGVADLQRQIFAVCPKRPGKWTRFLLEFFKKQGAVLQITTAKKHDQLMAFIQGLIHLSSIAMGMAFKDLGLSLKETLSFSSPIYRLRLDMVGRILHQDPRLYGEIAIENPLTKNALRAYEKAIHELLSSVESHNLKKFSGYFMKAADHLGGFNEQAYKRTSQLIQRSKTLLS